ncbi:phosphomannomutase [Ochrobactrum intermedium]|uniref:phosphomannomutase n=1 Tax=Brucella intermedia TaxID=94625 RepID=UPI00128BEB4A|nr:phosphomannomutase [Brucella intermedia]MPR63804.1 phosphomannomutase [Brucella intermedia]
MAVAFGTSGLRGPAYGFTDNVCAGYILSFLRHISSLFEFRNVYIAADLRESSPRIAIACVRAIEAGGKRPIWAGNVPTPALAAYAIARNSPAIMITGSHIPESYNGIKFYRPDGEFLKEDEAPVRSLAEKLLNNDIEAQPNDMPAPLADVAEEYVGRSISSFGSDALTGTKIGFDLHSAVGRDLLVRIFEGLGAEVYPFRRMDKFIAVDTEALDPSDLSRASAFIAEHGLDAVVSTDGDGDRPLVIDDQGRQINGDVLGILTARYLGAKTVVTPLSTTSALEESGWFENIHRTRIGSPYVVAEMTQAVAHPVVGFEANGGFLLGDDVTLKSGLLRRLPTRDSVLPAVAVLVQAKDQGVRLSEMVATLPSRFMKADRVKEVPADRAAPFLRAIETSQSFRSSFSPLIAEPESISTVDGVRMAFANGDTVHFRQSGNAPEMRIYIETDSAEKTDRMLSEFIAKLSEAI